MTEIRMENGRSVGRSVGGGRRDRDNDLVIAHLSGHSNCSRSVSFVASRVLTLSIVNLGGWPRFASPTVGCIAGGIWWYWAY